MDDEVDCQSRASGASSSAGERPLHTGKVTGSIPVSPTSAEEILKRRLGIHDLCVDRQTETVGGEEIKLRTELMVTVAKGGGFGFWVNLREPNDPPNCFRYIDITDVVSKMAPRKRRVDQRRDNLPPSVRFDVLKRDGFRCTYCGVGAAGAVLHVDHIQSKWSGGADDMANLTTACEDCNMGKGKRPL